MPDREGWSIRGKITDAILRRGKGTREIPRDSKPAVKPGTKIEGWPQGAGEGRKKKKK
jgi:hypothetical protein